MIVTRVRACWAALMGTRSGTNVEQGDVSLEAEVSGMADEIGVEANMENH